MSPIEAAYAYTDEWLYAAFTVLSIFSVIIVLSVITGIAVDRWLTAREIRKHAIVKVYQDHYTINNNGVTHTYKKKRRR